MLPAGTVALFAGLVMVTVGGVVSEPPVVVMNISWEYLRLPALSSALAHKLCVPDVGIFTTTDQLVGPVTGIGGPRSTCSTTLFIPLPPVLSCEVPDTVMLPASTVALFAGLVMVTVGVVISTALVVYLMLHLTEDLYYHRCPQQQLYSNR